MPVLTTKDEMESIDPAKFRFIPGAPPGVCASLTSTRVASDKPCEQCQVLIKEDDGKVWYCDASFLHKRRKGGLCFWHFNCLKPAPPSAASA